MNVLLKPPPGPPALGVPEPDQQFALDRVAWADYEAVGDLFRNRPNLRITFDRGRLELMTKSYEHERVGWLLGLLVSVLAEECNLSIGGAGQTTLKSQLAARGLEPDQCFYAASLAAVRGKSQIDLAVDPPPDLAIEIDVSQSSLARIPIYAALNVPEVWRWQGDVIRVYQLTAAGGYDESDASTAFLPGFPVGELARFVHVGYTSDDTAMTRAFRAWVRQWATDRGLAAP
jgi:Uma2 family endonuclease